MQSSLPNPDRASTFELYRATDRESAEIRAQLLQQSIALTPALMVANALCVVMIIASLGAAGGLALWLWAATLLAVCLKGLHNWRLSRRRRIITVSTRAFSRATLHATAMGLAWAFVPLWWFPSASGAQQVLIASLVTGMLSAGAFALANMPMASIAFACTIALGSLGALWLTAQPLFIPVAVLLLCYTVIVMLGAMAAARQSTSLLRARGAQAKQARLLSLLLRDFEANASDALWETGTNGVLKQASPRLAEVFGAQAEQLMSTPFVDWLHHRVQEAEPVLATFGAGQPFRDLRVQIGEGDSARWCALSAKPKRLDEDAEEGWRGVVTDITQAMRSEIRLRRLAHEDSLTGLANRLTVCEAVRVALGAPDHGMLMSIDLDHFKAVNDTLGHSAGDEVLRIVAERLRRTVRPLDLVARLGGDEFAVLLAAIDTEDAQSMASRIIETLSAPMRVGERQVQVGASVGLARLHADVLSVEELMVNADLALYDAKRDGRGRCATYTPQLGENSRRNHRLEHDLLSGLHQGQFELHFQPKMALAKWQPEGVEALLRWHHPVLGSIPPTEFIAAAERCGAINELGAWALRQACLTARNFPGLTMAVNVSPLQLMHRRFVDEVRDVLHQTGLAAQRLELEITESVLLGDAGAALEQLHRLRALGVRIALDDFGTGYSSLAYLRRFPFDVMKIDRAFVREVTQSEDARAIINMIIKLARQLGMSTVAEGVESTQQLEVLRAAGCQDAQGYLIARPLPLSELAAWMATRLPAQQPLAVK